MPFIFFSHLILLAKTNIVLNSNGESGHPFLFQMPLISVRKILWIPSCWIFYLVCMLDFVKCFSEGPALLVEKMSLRPLNCFFTVVRISWLFLCGSVSVLFLLLLTDLLVCLLLIFHCFNYCSIMVSPSLKYSNVSHPILFQNYFSCSSPFAFP